jgi:hypothetical protein
MVRTIWIRHVACMPGRTLRECTHLEDLGIDGGNLNVNILKKWDWTIWRDQWWDIVNVVLNLPVQWWGSNTWSNWGPVSSGRNLSCGIESLDVAVMCETETWPFWQPLLQTIMSLWFAVLMTRSTKSTVSSVCNTMCSSEMGLTRIWCHISEGYSLSITTALVLLESSGIQWLTRSSSQCIFLWIDSVLTSFMKAEKLRNCMSRTGDLGRFFSNWNGRY